MANFLPPFINKILFGNQTGSKRQLQIEARRAVAGNTTPKTQKERDEENIRMSTVQGIQAATIFAPMLQLLQHTGTRLLIPFSYLKQSRIDTQNITPISYDATNNPQASLTEVIQTLLNELQARLTTLTLLLEKVHAPLQDFTKFENEYQQFWTIRTKGYQQLAQNLANALDQNFASFGNDRLFDQSDLAFITGAVNSHPSLPPIGEPPAYTPTDTGLLAAEDVLIADMRNELQLQFPYTPDLSPQYSTEQYSQITQDLSRVLVSRKQSIQEVQQSSSLRNQLGMILRPRPETTTVHTAQQQLQTYNHETQQQHAKLNAQRVELQAAVLAAQNTMAQIQEQYAGIDNLIYQINSLMNNPAFRNNPMIVSLRQQFHIAIGNINQNNSVHSSIALQLGQTAIRTPSVLRPRPADRTAAQHIFEQREQVLQAAKGVQAEKGTPDHTPPNIASTGLV